VIKFRSGDPRDLDKQSRAEQHETLAAAVGTRTRLVWASFSAVEEEKEEELRRKWRQKHEQSAD